jgi:alcohol dehydrogenase, propanol-preferring
MLIRRRRSGLSREICCFLGLPADQYVQLSIFEIVGNNIKIVGSTLGNRVDLAKTFELHAAGKTKVITEVRKLEQVNEAFAEVETGKAKARLVFDLR